MPLEIPISPEGEEILKMREEATRIFNGSTDPYPIRKDLPPIDTIFIGLTGMTFQGKDYDMPTELQAFYDMTMNTKDNLFPDMTFHLVTGRPWKYVDAFSLNTHMRGYGPHIAENGGMIVEFGGPGKQDNETYLVADDELEWIEPMQKLLLEKLPENTKIEGKKQTMLTLNAPDIDDIAKFAGMSIQIIKESEYADQVDYTYSKSGFDIMPKGYNRLDGVRYILEKSNKHFETCAFFGNSTNDEPLLAKTGKALVFTDSYAEKPIKEIVQSKRGIVSDLPHGYATLDGIYRIFIHDVWHTRKSSPRIYKIQ